MSKLASVPSGGGGGGGGGAAAAAGGGGGGAAGLFAAACVQFTAARCMKVTGQVACAYLGSQI